MSTDAPLPPAPSGAKLRKAVNLTMCEEGATVADKFRILRDAGFDGVELNRPDPLPLAEIARAQAATGLEIAGVTCATHWEQPLTHPDPQVREAGFAGLRRAMEESAELGCGQMLLVPGAVNAEVAYDVCWQRSIAAIRRAATHAEELRCRIGIENVWNHFLMSPLEAVRYLDEIGSPWVGWHFDPGNVVTFGWPEQWLRILGARVVNLHVKDYSRAKRDAEGLWKGFEVELGEGDVCWPAVMQAVADIGYTGFVTAEVPGGNRARLAQLAAQIDRICGA